MNHKKWMAVIALAVTALILTHLPVSEADAAASASDFQTQGSTLVKYRGTEERVTIPDTVEVVGESAFENNQKVQFVVIPKSVKRLDAYVFWGCNYAPVPPRGGEAGAAFRARHQRPAHGIKKFPDTGTFSGACSSEKQRRLRPNT